MPRPRNLCPSLDSMSQRREYAYGVTARLARIGVCLVTPALLMMVLPLPKDDAVSEPRHVVVHPHEPLVSFVRKMSARRLVRSAQLLLQRGDLTGAATHLRLAIGWDKGSAGAYASRAQVRLLRGDNLGAIGDADYAISLQPKSALAFYTRGLIYARMGFWSNATSDYRTATLLDPHFRQGMADYGLGWSLMAQGRYADAVISYTRAVGRMPLPAPSYFQRSRAYEQLGDIDAALSDMNAVIRSIPQYPEAHHRRAHLFMLKRVHGAALSDLTVAIANDPNDRFAVEDMTYLCGAPASEEQCRLSLDPARPPAADHPQHFEFAH